MLLPMFTLVCGPGCGLWRCLGPMLPRSVSGSATTTSSSVIITVIYRRPSAALGEFLNDLDRFISNSRPITRHIITGDLNRDQLGNQVNVEYSTVISAYDFHNIIGIPTHSCSTKQISLNFSSHSDIPSGTMKGFITDHLPTFMKLAYSEFTDGLGGSTRFDHNTEFVYYKKSHTYDGKC